MGAGGAEGSLETKAVLNQAIAAFRDQKGASGSQDRTLPPHCPMLDGTGILIVPQNKGGERQGKGMAGGKTEAQREHRT